MLAVERERAAECRAQVRAALAPAEAVLGRGLAGLLEAAQGNANAELAADHPRDLERLVEPADAKPRRAEGRCDEKLRTLEHAHACGKPHRQPVPGGEIGRVLEAMDEAVHGKCIVECR